jgi:mRNA interferase MazF
MAKPEPQRGEVWTVDLGYKEKRRPCLVLSVPVNNEERNLVTFVSRTTSDRAGSRFEIVDSSDLFPNRPGVFDAQSINTEDRSKFPTKVGRIGPELLVEVETAVKRWLGFDEMTSTFGGQ